MNNNTITKTNETILYDSEKFKIIEANCNEHVIASAGICSKEFVNCPFFGGLEVSADDIYLIALEAARQSIKDNLLYVVIEKETDEIVTTSVGLSYKGKQEFEKAMENIKLSFDLDMYNDLASQVEIVERNNDPNSVYLYLFATLESKRNMHLGTNIVKVVLKDLVKKGYKMAYGGTVNEKAEYIVKKNGAKIHKKMFYENYEFKGKRLKIIKQGETQTSFVFDLVI
jgi:hypothetical protein